MDNVVVSAEFFYHMRTLNYRFSLYSTELVYLVLIFLALQWSDLFTDGGKHPHASTAFCIYFYLAMDCVFFFLDSSMDCKVNSAQPCYSRNHSGIFKRLNTWP